tara:strand:+ start:364 stop:585 length:222 start_codon:yes stop_codon:yes gene_type:complete
MNLLTIKEGTLIKESEVGHNNFYYPFGEPYETPVEIEAVSLSWMDPSATGHYAYLTKNLDKNRVIWVAKQISR